MAKDTESGCRESSHHAAAISRATAGSNPNASLIKSSIGVLLPRPFCKTSPSASTSKGFPIVGFGVVLPALAMAHGAAGAEPIRALRDSHGLRRPGRTGLQAVLGRPSLIGAPVTCAPPSIRTGTTPRTWSARTRAGSTKFPSTANLARSWSSPAAARTTAALASPFPMRPACDTGEGQARHSLGDGGGFHGAPRSPRQIQHFPRQERRSRRRWCLWPVWRLGREIRPETPIS